MRLTPLLRLLSIVLPLLAAGGFRATAQPVYPYQQYSPYGAAPPPQIRRDLRAYPPGYYPGKLVQPAPQAPGFSLRRLFGAPDESSAPAARPVARPRRVAPAPKPVVRQEKPKPSAATQVVVFGDVLSGYAEQGLADLYADSEDVAVVRKTRDDSGLMRSDPEEWPKSIKDVLESGQKVTLAVVMVGSKDRQALKDQAGEHEPLSPEWRDAYRQRVDGVMRLFKDRGIPVVWIGLPPVKNEAASEDFQAMNEIFKEIAERDGGSYVDIWPGFVDEDNAYAATGPDVDGQSAKLRTSDGVLFTRAGARKVAHFADTAIKNALAGQAAASAGASPGTSQGPPQDGPAAPVAASLPAPPEAAVPAALPSKPLIGPVVPLTRPDVTPGGTLVSSQPKLTGDQAYPIQRALREGVAPGSLPGRADDFRWPPQEP